MVGNFLLFFLLDHLGFPFVKFKPFHRYSYSFPFLDTKGIVGVDDDRVGPLYEHTFPPSLAPSLSFVGIPRKVHFVIQHDDVWPVFRSGMDQNLS